MHKYPILSTSFDASSPISRHRTFNCNGLSLSPSTVSKSTQYSSAIRNQSYYGKLQYSKGRECERVMTVPDSPLTQRRLYNRDKSEKKFSFIGDWSPSIDINTKSAHINDEITRIHSEVAILNKNKKYKQAMSLLYKCERLSYSQAEIPASLRAYTKYLIVTIYYKAEKFEKCIEIAKKAIDGTKDNDMKTEQYLLHINHILAKSLYSNNNSFNAIKLLRELIDKYYQMKKDFATSMKIFNEDHLIMVKNDLAQYLLVNLKLIIVKQLYE